MVVFFKNRNDELKEYTADVITDIDAIERGCIYIDVTNALSAENREMDYKKLHIQSVSLEDIICFGNSLEAIAGEYPKYFI